MNEPVDQLLAQLCSGDMAAAGEVFVAYEIAQQTGLHPDSVRRILRTVARRLAFERQGSEVKGQVTDS